jgi:hypothetical protein
MTVIVVALVIGLPLVIVGLTTMGLVGWITAAVVLPVAALVALLRIGRETTSGDASEPGDDHG